MIWAPGVRRRLYGAAAVLPVGVVQVVGDASWFRVAGIMCLAATPFLIFDAVVRQVRTPMVVVFDRGEDSGGEGSGM